MTALTDYYLHRMLGLKERLRCCRTARIFAMSRHKLRACAFWHRPVAGVTALTLRFKARRNRPPTELFFKLIFRAAPEDVAAFNAAAQAAAEAGGVDVLLTHSSCSSATVASLNVKVHAWGHIHNHYGVRLVQKQEQWLDVCACSVDGEYAHTHGVVLVDIPQSS